MIVRVIGLFVLAWMVCDKVIHRTVASDLTEQEAQEIAVMLNRNGIAATTHCLEAKKKGDSKLCSVQIRGGDRTEVFAWGVLQDSGLPRKRDVGLIQVAQPSGMIPTPEESKAKLLIGLSGELNQTLKQMPGVVEARVLAVVPDSSPFRQKVNPSASVFVKHWASIAPPDETQVEMLVARAIEGLTPENVAVVYSKIEPTAQDGEGQFLLAVLPSAELVLDYTYLCVAIVVIGLLGMQFSRSMLSQLKGLLDVVKGQVPRLSAE